MEATVRVKTLVVAALMAVPMVLRAQQDGLEDPFEPGDTGDVARQLQERSRQIGCAMEGLARRRAMHFSIDRLRKLRGPQRASVLPKQAPSTGFLQHQPAAGRELHSVW